MSKKEDQARLVPSPLYPELPKMLEPSVERERQEAAEQHMRMGRRIDALEIQQKLLAMEQELLRAEQKIQADRMAAIEGGLITGKLMKDDADKWRVPGLAIAIRVCTRGPISQVNLANEICDELQNMHIKPRSAKHVVETIVGWERGGLLKRQSPHKKIVRNLAG